MVSIDVDDPGSLISSSMRIYYSHFEQGLISFLDSLTRNLFSQA